MFKNGLLHGRKAQQMHGEEMAATAWAVAAILHLGLPLELVFHEEGYPSMQKWVRDCSWL